MSSGNPESKPSGIPRIHIVGRRNSGKTTLVCELVRILTQANLKVATVKHTHHHHELDTPGKDSWKHRESGAAAVGILSPQMTALFIPQSREQITGDREQRYSAFYSAFSDFDLILVEGDLQTTAPRFEVWRAETGEPPYAATDSGISILVSDDQLPQTTARHLRRSEPPEIARVILDLMQRSHS